MLHSMTGYGSNSFKVQDLEIDIEVKSLNSRYFDSKISIPSVLSTYELEIDNIAKNKLVRGKVDLTIKISGLNNDLVTFNKKVMSFFILVCNCSFKFSTFIFPINFIIINISK